MQTEGVFLGTADRHRALRWASTVCDPHQGHHSGDVEPCLCGTKYTAYIQYTAAFVLPQTLLTDAARYFVQAPGAFYSATPGVSLLDKHVLN